MNARDGVGDFITPVPTQPSTHNHMRTCSPCRIWTRLRRVAQFLTSKPLFGRLVDCVTQAESTSSRSHCLARDTSRATLFSHFRRNLDQAVLSHSFPLRFRSVRRQLSLREIVPEAPDFSPSHFHHFVSSALSARPSATVTKASRCSTFVAPKRLFTRSTKGRNWELPPVRTT